MDRPARGDEGGDAAGMTDGSSAVDDEPVVVGPPDAAVAFEHGDTAVRQAGDAEPGDRSIEEVVEAAAREDAAAVDDRDAVADTFDLGQQVRVQEDRCPGVAQAGG